MTEKQSCYLISTYIPVGNLENVVRSLLEEIQLEYSIDYSKVYWCSAIGFESFRNKKNIDNLVGSIKLEFTIRQDLDLLDRVVELIKISHEWETPVITTTAGIRFV